MRTNETDIQWPDRKETVGVATSTGPMTTLFASRKITVEVILIHVFITQHPAFHEHVVCSFNEHGPTKQDAGMRTNETDIRWPDRKETVGVATSTGPMPTTFASRKITVEVRLVYVLLNR